MLVCCGPFVFVCDPLYVPFVFVQLFSGMLGSCLLVARNGLFYGVFLYVRFCPLIVALFLFVSSLLPPIPSSAFRF